MYRSGVVEMLSEHIRNVPNFQNEGASEIFVSECPTASTAASANRREGCKAASCPVTQPAVTARQQDLGRLIPTGFDKEVEGLKLNRSTQIL